MGTDIRSTNNCIQYLTDIKLAVTLLLIKILMKKGVGMALAEKVMKQGIEIDLMFSQLHAQWFLPHDTISRGAWPH